MSQILNRVFYLQTKLNNLPFNQTNNFLKVTKSYLNTSDQQGREGGTKLEDKSPTTSLNDTKISYLNSKLINYNHGWNNLNILALCEKSSSDLYVNQKTGNF